MHRFTEAERRDVGRWLQQIRKDRYSSREDMAAASGRVGVSTIYAIETGERRVSDESWEEYLRLVDLTEADVLRHRGIEEINEPEDPGAVLPYDPSRRLKFKDYPPEIRYLGLLIMRWLWMLPRQERRDMAARLFAMMAVVDEDEDD